MTQFLLDIGILQWTLGLVLLRCFSFSFRGLLYSRFFFPFFFTEDCSKQLNVASYYCKGDIPFESNEAMIRASVEHMIA